jgi:phenylalanyl-tRNA synthetase alpha chain
MNDLTALETDLAARIDAAADLDAIEACRIDLLGKKGQVTELMKTLGSLPVDERKARGAALNVLKTAIETRLARRKEALAAAALDAKLAADTIDVTLPARPSPEGRIHPISQTIDELVSIFGEMGFAVAEGPDIESDDYNFTRLNIPPEHPARQSHDTFYLVGKDGAQYGNVLRTHTSPVQVRTMLGQKPPIRIVAPGRTYRSDSDATHSPNFHQIEGLLIDKNSTMAHLKGCLVEFVRAFFEIPDLRYRFRPSYFPFTEPSAEMDIACTRGNGELKLGVGDDWLEILGCGMVSPKVLAMCGIDPNEYQGFAFGMGIERVAMLKYGIPDLRTFYEADLRWLKHYGFLAVDVPTLAGGLAR